jgi:hypothetical protein
LFTSKQEFAPLFRPFLIPPPSLAAFINWVLLTAGFINWLSLAVGLAVY